MNTILLLLSHFLASTAVGAGMPLQVIARNPQGRTESARASNAITVTFNQPMVALASPSEMGDQCPLRIEPPIPGRCRWQGTQTVTFEPSQPLPAASEYRVTVPADTRSQVNGTTLSQAESWTFETQRPGIFDSRPHHDERWIDLSSVFFVHFNLEMDPARARDFIVLEETPISGGETRQLSVGVRRAKPDEIKKVWPWSYHPVAPSTANVLAIKPSQLKPDHSYRLRLREGLLSASGNLGLLSERVIGFETWYTFRLVSAPDKDCLPHSFTLHLSNPVVYKDLFNHMSVEPSTPMPTLPEYQTRQTGGQDARNRRVAFNMPDIGYKPDTRYSFKIDKRLKDVFGNTLGEDVRFTLQTGNYCPRLTMPQGFGILEGYLPARHPVTAINMPQTALQKAEIPIDKLIPFYQSADWSVVKPQVLENVVSKTWDISSRLNLRLRTFFDLDEVLGRRGGLAFSQVQDQNGHWLKALDNVTRLGMTIKDSVDTTFIWVTYLKTGAPAKNVPLEIRDENNRVLWTGVSDANGFADAPGWNKLGISDWKRWQRPKLWVIAKDNGGPAVLANDWRGGLAPWRFNIHADWYPRPRRFSGAVFSDRGVYRPGETVHFKGIVRKLMGGDWAQLGVSPSDPKLLRLSITDSRGIAVVKTTVTVSQFSSFDFSQALREDAPTGIWSVTVTNQIKEDGPETVRPVEGDESGESGEYIGRETFLHINHTFSVEAFKPASFEVKVAPGASSYIDGDEYVGVIDGWYLFGAPMTDAPVDWKLRLQPSAFTPPGYDGFDFSPGWWRQQGRMGRLAASATGKLDAKGKMKMQAQLSLGKNAGPMAAVLEAGVSSPDRQHLFGRATVIVHPANLYLGIRPSASFLEKGNEWRGDIVAVRPDGVRVAGIPVQGKLIRRDWLSVQRTGLAGRLEWVSEQREVSVTTFSYKSDASTRTWSFTPDQPGQYFLTVSANDEAGKTAESSISFYVTGGGDAWWSRSDHDMIELVPDQKRYKPGETARILVKSPYETSRVLVTLEREGVMSRWLTNIKGGANMISVPISESCLPDVFVGVMLVQGRKGASEYDAEGNDMAKPQAKFGYVHLSVDPGGRRLSVKVDSDKTEYRPRMPVTVSVQAKDEAGAPTPGAELTVYAVDEGVLALTGYNTPDIFSRFYGDRPLLVGTVDSRQYVIGQRSFGEKGENRGGGGGQGMSLEGVDLRSRFIPTAYWNPSVRTGADGKAQVTFTLPDNLSRFRLMAVAHVGKRFGSGDARLTVTKPLLLRPSLPRLARVGDVFEGGIVVHNYTSRTSTVSVQLAQDGDVLSIDGSLRREIIAGPHAAVEVLWKCRALKTGNATLQFKAVADAESDGISWPLPVRAPEKLEQVATTGVVSDSVIEELARPLDAVRDSGAIKITLSPTALAGLQDGARYLLEYPYGCLEQRLSRMLPVIVSADLTAAFKLGTVDALKGDVQKGLDRLPDFQTVSGGFGYWTNPWLPDPYITAYALEVSALAGKEGYRLPKESLAKAVAWLKSYLSSNPQLAYPYNENEAYAARAYAVYVLALNGEPLPGYFQQLYAKRDQIPLLAKTFLLKAAPLVLSDQGPRQTLAAELLNQGRVSPRSMHFEEPSEIRMPWVHSSTVKTTAMILQSLLEAQGGFPGDEKAVQWLVGERKDKGRWRTTQENASSLRALQDFYRRYEKDEPAFTAQLAQENGAQLWQGNFTGRTLLTRTQDFAPAAIFGATADRSRLRLSKVGTGRLYYALGMSYAPSSFATAASEGFEIEKTVTPLYGKSKTLLAGARAIVTLIVRTKQDRTFVAINDFLPAGFEIVDPSFSVESREDSRALAEQGARGHYWGEFSRNEKYDDRIQVFADFLSAGEHKYSYLIQATTPGTFHSPATWVEQMYEPEVFGRTASQTVTIEK